MTGILDHAHRDIIINGHRVVGFADEQRPAEWSTGEELYNAIRGKTGALQVSSNGVVGRGLTLRVLGTSDTAKWGIGQLQAYHRAVKDGTQHIIYKGTDADAVEGSSLRMEGGVLMDCPVKREPDTTFEFSFLFEEVVPNDDGSTTSSAPGSRP